MRVRQCVAASLQAASELTTSANDDREAYMDRASQGIIRLKRGSGARRKARQANGRATRAARTRHLRLAGEMLESRWLLASSVLPGGALPLAFEINAGQIDSRVNFLSRGAGYTVFLTAGEAELVLNRANSSASASLPATGDPQADDDAAPSALNIQLVGANSAAVPTALDALASKSNYFLGSDPTQWTTNVAQFGRVKYAGVYPGIDQVFYGDQGKLQFDFVIAPGASADQIALDFSGADGLAIDESGSLVITVEGQTVVQHAPMIYQALAGTRQTVSGHYVLTGPTQARFVVGAYDQTREFTSDSTLT